MKRGQPDIIILGLGPGDPDLLTLKAAGVINEAERIYLRTKEHPTLSGLPSGLEVISFDDYYHEEEIYEDVYQRIADEIIRLARDVGPIQIILAGKAHPDDDIGSAHIEEILDHIDQLNAQAMLIE